MRGLGIGSRLTAVGVVAVLLLAACATQAPGTPAPPAAVGRLYVVNSSSASLSSFAPLDTVTGNVAPATRIAGPSTSLPTPGPPGLHLDVANDRAYVAISSEPRIVIFDNVSRATGDAGPTREISGTHTQLAVPLDVSLDAPRNLLYVAEQGAAIRVYRFATIIHGDVAPVRVIEGPLTLLDPTDKKIFIDSASDRLYVSQSSEQLMVWDNASTHDGNTAPTRVITSPALNHSWGSWVDVGRNEWFVANDGGDSVTVFANASTATGEIAPVRTIQGPNTGLLRPVGVIYDPASDRLYVANGDNSIRVWHRASTVDGNVAPDRVIAGPATQLSFPRGMGIDRTR